MSLFPALTTVERLFRSNYLSIYNGLNFYICVLIFQVFCYFFCFIRISLLLANNYAFIILVFNLTSRIISLTIRLLIMSFYTCYI